MSALCVNSWRACHSDRELPGGICPKGKDDVPIRSTMPRDAGRSQTPERGDGGQAARGRFRETAGATLSPHTIRERDWSRHANSVREVPHVRSPSPVPCRVPGPIRPLPIVVGPGSGGEPQPRASSRLAARIPACRPAATFNRLKPNIRGRRDVSTPYVPREAPRKIPGNRRKIHGYLPRIPQIRPCPIGNLPPGRTGAPTTSCVSCPARMSPKIYRHASFENLSKCP